MYNLTREQILNERTYWYNQVFIILEVVKCLKNRELAFLSAKSEEIKHPVRYLIAFNLEYLNKHFKRFAFEKSLMNMYHSVAKLENIPVFSYNLSERRNAEEYQDFNRNYEKFVTGYNFFVDMDCKEDFNKGFEEAKEFKKVLDEFSLPYYCLNSSFQGFHFCIQAEYMPKMEIKELLVLICNVLYNIKGIYDFTTMDISITDLKRLQKIPYSYCCDGSVCLPLTDEMFSNFTPNMVSMKSVLKNVKIKNRGLLVRNLELGEEKLKSNVLRFLNDFK